MFVKISSSPNNRYSYLNHLLVLLVAEVVVVKAVVAKEMTTLGWAIIVGVVAQTMMGWANFVLVEATMS